MKRNKTRKFTMLRMLRNERGVALIWSYLLSVSLLTMLTSFYSVSTWDLKNMVVEGQRHQAFYLAEAGIDKMLVQIKSGNFNNITTTQLGSAGTYEVSYNSTNNTITSTGRMTNGIHQTLVARVSGTDTGIPPGVLSALTVGNVDLSGNFYIDGANHNAEGNLLNDGNGLPGIAYFGDEFTVWPSNVKIGTEGAAPAYPSSPNAALALTSNDTIKSVNAVFGLSESSTTLNQYKHTEVPEEALDNEIYYFQPKDLESQTRIDLDGGSGIFIIEGNTLLTGSFTGLIIVHGASQVTFDSVRLVGGFIATAPNENAYAIQEVTDDAKNTDYFSSILFSREVISQLPTINGAVYVDTHPYISVWTDNLNGSDRYTTSLQAETAEGTGLVPPELPSVGTTILNNGNTEEPVGENEATVLND